MRQFIEAELRDAYGRLLWWKEGVAKHFGQREMQALDEIAAQSNIGPLSRLSMEDAEKLDINHFRNIVEGNWRSVFGPKLHDRETALDYIKEVTKARNHWAHPGHGDPAAADVFRVLDSCARLTKLFDSEANRRIIELRDYGSPPITAPAIQKIDKDRVERAAEIKKAVENVLSNYGRFARDDWNTTYMHFAPTSWDAIVPKVGSQRSGRILWFMFENRHRGGSLRLYLEICPGSQSVREKIFDAAKTSGDFRPPKNLSDKWCRIYRRDLLGPAEYHQDDIGAVELRIKNEFRSFVRSDLPKLDLVISGIPF